MSVATNPGSTETAVTLVSSVNKLIILLKYYFGNENFILFSLFDNSSVKRMLANLLCEYAL